MAEKEIRINIPADSKPAFANAAQVIVSDDAVIIQFSFVRPRSNAGELLSEIVLSPKHAINFSRSLDETIKKHFTRHLEEK